MQLPNVIHPKLIKVGEYTLQIVAYCPMTDAQALKAALHFLRMNKLKKSAKKGVIRALTTFDERSVGML